MFDFGGRAQFILAGLEKWLIGAVCGDKYGVHADDVLVKIAELDAEYYDKTHKPEPFPTEEQAEEEQKDE